MDKKIKIGVLVSGSGSNLQSLIDLCADPAIPAEIVSVISNKPDVFALERAKQARIPAHVIDHRIFADRDGFDAALDVQLRCDGVEFVCLAGFMRILTPGFIAGWPDRMVNIHPSLLPLFKGLHTHRQALAAGVRLHGCTVHFVRPALDDGPILIQAAIPVLDGDDEQSLAARVLAAEHQAYPKALRLIAEGRVTVVGNRVMVNNPEYSVPSPLVFP